MLGELQLVDEDLAEWNAFHGAGASAPTGIGADEDLAEWNSFHASKAEPTPKAPAFLDDPIGYFAGTSNWGVENVIPNLTSSDFWFTRPSGEYVPPRESVMGMLKGTARAGTDLIATPADLIYRGGQGAVDAITGNQSDLTGTYPSDIRNNILDFISGGEGNKSLEEGVQLGGNLATIIAAPTQAKNIAAKVSSWLPKVPGASTIASLLGLGAEGAAQSIYMNPKGDIAQEGLTGAAINTALSGGGSALGKLWDTFVPTTKTAEKAAAGMAGDIVDEFRKVTPDAFSDGLTLEQRAIQAAKALEAKGIRANEKAGALFKEIPSDPVILDDAINNIVRFAEKVEGPIAPGGTTFSLVNMLKGLKPADEILETPPSLILDEFGKPAVAGTSKVIPGGPAVLPLNKVQDTLRDIGVLQQGTKGINKAVLGKAKDEILQAAERSVSPDSMKALNDARGAWATMKSMYEKSAVGSVRKSLAEPGKRLSILKTKLLNDPKSAKEITRVMTPRELSNVQNIVLMDLTAKAPVTWEKAISKQYDSYKHIFGEENTEMLLKMVAREGSIGSKLLKENNGLGGLLAKTGLKGIIGGSIGYEVTGDWKGAALGTMLSAGKARLEGKGLNQAKSLIMRAAIGSPEALKILNSAPKNKAAYDSALKKLATVLPASLNREESSTQPLQGKTAQLPSINSDKEYIASKVKSAEAKMEDPKPPVVIRANRVDSEEFHSKVKDIAKDLGAKPEHLMKVMSFETGGTLDPKQKNKAGSGATGLIQFMPKTAKELTGAHSEQAAIKLMEEMSPTEQLDYVKKHLSRFKGKLNTLADVYMAVLYPKAVGKDSQFALFREKTRAYWQNRGLDLNNDGIITKEEAAKKVETYKV